MLNIDQMTLQEMAGYIRRGELTSEALVTHYLDRIDQVNPKINAVVIVAEREELLRNARQADEQASLGEFIGPLHGVPVTIKDVCHVKGYSMSRGIAELKGAPSTQDATVVARLREAGALILGITNVPELCMAFETDNLLYGPTLNPHDLLRSAGGSSGGEAAAIASGCSPAGLGSDACGSVRIPAHFNGISSLKLTQGRVPLTGQFPKERSGLFHLTSAFGVMGRYVDDLELLGRIISGADGRDPDTTDAPFVPSVPLADMRVALFYESNRMPLSKCVRSVVDRVAALLKQTTGSVTPDCPPNLEEASDVLWRAFITGGDSGRAWKSMFTAMGKTAFSPALNKLLEFSEKVELTVDELKQDWVMIDTFRFQLAQFFDSYDVLITPVFPDVAFRHGKSMDDPRQFGFVFPFSLSGSPAVVIPAGKDSGTGLPIGIQIVGPHWREESLLTLAKHIERELGAWRPVTPSPD
ncbi:amidase [Pseudomonas benzenivorans]|uniref:Amidase n=1 Tax=Pseudomonas benzenivorans TaxID=556533 RepID=A0ABY5HA59_9PSED|nr:amidase [Pseudomonas benzenivorans]UTW08180.1 amidase [Pseudomonas benzenivorans]